MRKNILHWLWRDWIIREHSNSLDSKNPCPNRYSSTIDWDSLLVVRAFPRNWEKQPALWGQSNKKQNCGDFWDFIQTFGEGREWIWGQQNLPIEMGGFILVPFEEDQPIFHSGDIGLHLVEQPCLNWADDRRPKDRGTDRVILYRGETYHWQPRQRVIPDNEVLETVFDFHKMWGQSHQGKPNHHPQQVLQQRRQQLRVQVQGRIYCFQWGWWKLRWSQSEGKGQKGENIIWKGGVLRNSLILYCSQE